MYEIVNPSEHDFFLYESQNLIRETFVSEVNKQVHLIGSVSFLDKIQKDGKMQLVKASNKQKFDVKKNVLISYFEFNTSPMHANKKINFRKREMNNLMIAGTEKLARAGQKRKMVDIVETLLIKALQSYDKYTILNSLEVNLRSNYLNQKINDYKSFVYEVMLKNILFSSSIKNETQNIFITCQNLNSAKKALINGKIYSLLGIVNLQEIKNWKSIKGNSVYVNAKFDDTHYMENATHFGFKFKTSFPAEFLEFSCELLDDKAKQIEFESGETKVPIIDLQIDILK